MTLNEKITLAALIQANLNTHLTSLWPEAKGRQFTPSPFILYDEKHQVAVGEGWPEQYTKVQPGIWVAEGTDMQLMGCTSVLYHGRVVAIWDTRVWAEQPAVAVATAGLAHEMFHVYQTTLEIPYSNELLLPQYPHSELSVALVLEEATWLAAIQSTQDPAQLYDCLAHIAGLRQLREREIGAAYMEYDQNVESREGTAAFVEICMQAKLQGRTPLDCAASYLPRLQKREELLTRYRHHCYAVGLFLCLALDALVDDWQNQWVAAKLPLFEWIKQKLALTPIEHIPDASMKNTAAELVGGYWSKQERIIADYMAQPLICLEGDIALVGFDPMNLTCVGDRCLHIHGKVRLGDDEVLLERPFMEDFCESILCVSQIWMPGKIADLGAGRIEIEGLGVFCGTIDKDENRCKILK